jgi:DNA-binding ferritin-like protein
LQHTVKETIIACYSNLLDADTIAEYAAKECSIEELVSGLNDAYAAIQSPADDTIFEISNIDNVPDANYSEFDEAAVVQKYKNKNRGKN